MFMMEVFKYPVVTIDSLRESYHCYLSVSNLMLSLALTELSIGSSITCTYLENQSTLMSDVSQEGEDAFGWIVFLSHSRPNLSDNTLIICDLPRTPIVRRYRKTHQSYALLH
jgi:hypothetical protein